MNNLNGKFDDSFIAIMPSDDGSITVRRIFYKDVDGLEKVRSACEVSTDEKSLAGFTLTLVKILIRSLSVCFNCKGEWVKG